MTRPRKRGWTPPDAFGTRSATPRDMKTSHVSFGTLCMTLLVSGTATAQDRMRDDVRAGNFGDEGQLAISSDAGLSISNTQVSGVDDSTTSVVLRPAVDYFLVDHLSLGGSLGLAHTSTGGFSSTSWSIGPRIGYDFPLSERVSVWPKVGVSFASTSFDGDGGELPGVDVDDDETNTAVQLNLYVPFLFHPVQHFFIGFGPALDQDLSGDAKATTIAGRLTLGGWM